MEKEIKIKRKNHRAHLFCVFDGHGGYETAKLCVQKYPEIFSQCLSDNPFNFEFALKTVFI